jgi:hypothetical protein
MQAARPFSLKDLPGGSYPIVSYGVFSGQIHTNIDEPLTGFPPFP